MTYKEFLESKKHTGIDCGIKQVCDCNEMMDFQKEITTRLIKKGRGAGFIDTGLGKTLIELVCATNYYKHTGKPVLIMTPLAVAFQFIKEAEKFNIPEVSYSKTGKLESKITICNYERLDKFNPESFDCVILDESSILKNFDGMIKNQITSFLKKVKYRFLFTATPSPNDYVELGTSSEALGYLGYMDMLSKFFRNNDNNAIKSIACKSHNSGSEWYLKPHAENDFWKWVSSWSISVKKPSDIGFSDERYILPELTENYNVVKNQNEIDIDGQMCMFNFPASNFKEIKSEIRATIKERCERAVELASENETSVYWVNLNDESSMVKDIDDCSTEIVGSMDIDQKEEILIAFSNGQIKKLITKTSITAFGLNWQHCNHCVYFPTFSYERYYQAIRRFWRFGQKRPVTVDIVLSDGQTKIMDAVKAKKNKAIIMFDNLIKNANSSYDVSILKYENKVQIPTFIGEKNG
jgi:hypothetical protein